MASLYQQIIREEVARQGRVGANPRHVEAWMRAEHGTLDHLDRAAFAADVRIALACIAEAGDAQSEAVAQSYGL